MFNLFRLCRKEEISFEIVAEMLPEPATLLPKNGNNVEATFDFVKGRNDTINSFDTVAVCGNKVECCFDSVAGVDGA